MRVVVVGLGLIGGSTALKLRQTGFAKELIGVDLNTEHATKAVELGIVDSTGELIEEVAHADLVLLAIPVTAMENVLPLILDHVGDHTTVLDLGSTKERIVVAVDDHQRRAQFVAGHPIAGTENSGPEAAFPELFEGKTGILCDIADSKLESVAVARDCFENLGMHLIEMGSKEHDLHIAYVSHISHISSFVLGQTVLEIEKDEASIFNMAGSGFASTVRLAKSSPEMWAPIFKQNKTHISNALAAYIDNLANFKKMIDAGAENDLVHAMRDANDIRRVLDGINDKTKKKELV